jgi:hypothetical protein
MPLADFIEIPSQNLSQDELKTGVEELLVMLEKNSDQVVILIKDCFCPASYILRDLAKKMELEHCIEKFAVLYDRHLNELVELCVWSWHDLQRLIVSQPNYLEQIMETVNKNNVCVQRLLADVSNSEEIINYIQQLNPDYELSDQLIEFQSVRVCRF